MAGQMPGLDASKLHLVAELEMEMMVDMYNRMVSACHKKCIPPKYRDNDLSKGESVCLDRCVQKYLDVHDKIGKKLTSMTMADEDLMKKMNEQNQQQMAN
jgi:import inner membrane translocase subunit TIM10